MRYLVTGCAGFIGSNLTQKLIQLGHEVVGIDNLSTGKIENLGSTYSSMYFMERDITREIRCHTTEFDAIFHIAALARIQPSFKNPKATYEANSSGTINVLEFARQHNIKVIYAGSSSVYHEIHANPYAYTKWLGEQHCVLYSKVYEVKTAIARFFNVYGPHQPTDGRYATVIGIFEKQKAENKSLTITGDGQQRRDFTHVDDIVDGLILMSKTDSVWNGWLPLFKPCIFNFGTGRNHSILELAKMFNCPYTFLEKRPGEAQDTLADISFAADVLGYKPQRRLEDYLAQTLSV